MGATTTSNIGLDRPRTQFWGARRQGSMLHRSAARNRTIVPARPDSTPPKSSIPSRQNHTRGHSEFPAGRVVCDNIGRGHGGGDLLHESESRYFQNRKYGGRGGVGYVNGGRGGGGIIKKRDSLQRRPLDTMAEAYCGSCLLHGFQKLVRSKRRTFEETGAWA